MASISILERSGPWGFGCASNKPGSNNIVAVRLISVCVVTGAYEGYFLSLEEQTEISLQEQEQRAGNSQDSKCESRL